MKFGLVLDDINAINRIFAQYSSIEEVIIYGSRAKGNFKPSSDIDLSIVGSDLNFSQLAEIETKLDDLLLPFKIDLSQFHKIPNPELIDHINRIGQVFFKQ